MGAGFKTVIAVVTLVAAIGASSVLKNVVQPEADTTLAMKQMVEPSVVTDTAQRNLDFDWMSGAVYLVWGSATLLLFSKEIKGVFNE